MHRLALLENAADAIREEARALTRYAPMPYAEGYTGDWGAFLIWGERWLHEYPGVDLADNQRRCPRTLEVLRGLPGLRLAGFLRLGPGARILPHVDQREDDELRVHLGLDLAPRERAWWEPGRCRLLDIREEHEAYNDGERDRLTLVCDLAFPLPLPEVPPWTPPGQPAES
jgi:aspartyl/asparaginyl beta-hydroxylase (cupin superfamily)